MAKQAAEQQTSAPVVSEAKEPEDVEHKRNFKDVEAVVKALQPSYPVYCLRPEILQRDVQRFISLFPGTVMYAVKCNPAPLVLKDLYNAGIRHFDTASLPEIALVAETFSDVTSYFMHPIKSRAVIKTAFQVYGTRHFAVDHEDELAKVIDETGGGERVTVVVRINTPPDKDTIYHLSSKFGCEPAEGVTLLKAAAKKGCRTGISFHVGSQCRNPGAYRTALHIVGGVIEDFGELPRCVDVGGGFPADYLNMKAPPIEDFMEEIRGGLKDIALSPTVEVLAEPGRALVAAGCSLLTQVMLRKGDQLYINDGVYGSLSEMVVGGLELPARVIRLKGKPAKKQKAFTLNGPTCDSADVLPAQFTLPEDTREGDWIEIDRLGAYSNANATHFNGFYPETFVEVFDEPPGGSL